MTEVGIIVFFENAPPETVANEVREFFESEGYRLEKGEPACGLYGTGSTALRILFGAFVKRFKFNVDVQPGENYTELSIIKAMTGISGGVLGYSKMNKELDRIRDALLAHFA